MIRKTLIMASVLLFATTVVCLADTQPPQRPTNEQSIKIPPKGPNFQKRHEEFEKRLNLTEKQKQKAETLHKQGFEKMKPVMEKLKEKQEALKALGNSQEDIQQKEQLKKEILALRQEAREYQKQNMKDFENILTKKQKAELEKIKEEGRKNFDKEFKKHPPINKPCEYKK